MTLSQFFKARAARDEPMVLVTVYETVGSTYSKAGGQMLIDSDGNFCGMLSGGCLEGDLVERSRRVMQTGVAETASYDLAADDDIWGLGVGCDGTMRVLLQPLTSEQEYQPLAAVAERLDSGTAATLAIVIHSTAPSIEVGASMLLGEDPGLRFGIDDSLGNSIEREFVGEGATAAIELKADSGQCVALVTRIAPPPALLVLGGGLDAEPVLRIAAELGWRATLYDHRPAYVESRRLPPDVAAVSAPADGLADRVDLARIDLAIVMSHHLASDRSYLRQLAATNISYIGLLGPRARRKRLIAELPDAAGALLGRLHGPAGIDLGGRGPGPIALSIVAEMQQHLGQRGQV